MKQLSQRRMLPGKLSMASRQNPFQVGSFCRSYGVKRDAFVRLTGFSPRAVAHWASGKKPNPSSSRKLTELIRLFDALSNEMESKAIGPWLQEPNSAFDGSTPMQVVERGETDRLWRMIHELEAGEPG